MICYYARLPRSKLRGPGTHPARVRNHERFVPCREAPRSGIRLQCACNRFQKLDTTASGHAATRPHSLTLGPKIKSPFTKGGTRGISFLLSTLLPTPNSLAPSFRHLSTQTLRHSRTSSCTGHCRVAARLRRVPFCSDRTGGEPSASVRFPRGPSRPACAP